jgi:CheY-specific phosphatase CheX
LKKSEEDNMTYEIDEMGEELADAVSEAFENMFFADIVSCLDLDSIEVEKPSLIISVDTIAPFKGNVGLVIDLDYSNEIVLEMTGGDVEETTPEIVSDALNEIANTIVGRFLSRVVPEDEEFSLGFPECNPWEAENENSEQSHYRRLFAIEMEETCVYCILNKTESDKK